MSVENAKIDFKRFRETMEASSEIGRVKDTGLYRLALSDKDKEMRDLFRKWMEEAGLEVRIDDVGTMYGRRAGKEDLPPVLIGSHLDTQPYGGRYDGVIGVLMALEAIRTMNDYNIETRRPIEIVNFTNEEGARFEPPMMASGLLAGEFTKEFVHSRKDAEGLEFGEELGRIGYRGTEENRIKDIHSFVEVHIEQGPRLEKEGRDIGIVRGIQGVSWFEVTVQGKSNHAGSTPMHLRKDPMMAAARLISDLEELALEESVLMTIGKISASPGAVNVIPETVNFSIDVRSEDDEERNGFIRLLEERVGAIASLKNVDIDVDHTWTSPVTHFNSDVLEVISSKSESLGYSTLDIVSGAGHDARYINDIAPTAMIFAPSVGGISHDIAELTLDAYLEKCGTLLFEVVRELADRDEIAFDQEG
ncbi:M20 family metallo-hydrolase [Salinicoccus bachuensis]|uniref:M20 family metallo-hydrolase n=1 Tax=Salinicoccus bachuensis TaxID=3136731 RepID=A0ABZ3CLV2_9STAP